MATRTPAVVPFSLRSVGLAGEAVDIHLCFLKKLSSCNAPSLFKWCSASKTISSFLSTIYVLAFSLANVMLPRNMLKLVLCFFHVFRSCLCFFKPPLFLFGFFFFRFVYISTSGFHFQNCHHRPDWFACSFASGGLSSGLCLYSSFSCAELSCVQFISAHLRFSAFSSSS